MAQGMVDIALLTGLVKDLYKSETYAPAQVEMRNSRRSFAGNMYKRHGYGEWKDTGEQESVVALIPENDGYAYTSNGKIFSLGDSIINIHSGGKVTSSPRYINYDDGIIVANGLSPLIQITGQNVSLLLDSPTNTKFIETISGYVIVAGHDKTEFRWSGENNAESWPTDHTANIEKTGSLLNMVEQKDKLLMFKPRETEIWNFIGGSDPFVNYPGGEISQGTAAVDSVVKANDSRIYWLGNQGNFWVYESGVPHIISGSMKRYFDEMSNVHLFKGFDVAKEHLIMWLNHVDGVSILYDYAQDQWFEDNRWDGGWQSLPFDSYMEYNRKQYYGSHGLDGKIFEWGRDYKDDDGTAIRGYRKFKVRLSRSGKNVRIDEMLLRREGAMANDTSAAPVFSLRYRWDKGPWSKWKIRSLGAVGKHNPYSVKMSNLGMGIDFEVEMQHSDSTDFVFTNAFVTFTEALS